MNLHRCGVPGRRCSTEQRYCERPLLHYFYTHPWNPMTRPTADDIHKNHLAQEKNIETMSRQIDEIIFPLQHPECAAYRFSVDSLAYLEPFLGGGRTWLTVGDYNGFESSYLHRVKRDRVTATDLSDA